MPLEDFLMPGESVRYSSPEPVEYQGGKYYFMITDRRVIWHRQKGLIFKKDNVISENISDIVDMVFNEKGIVSKKGIVNITTTRKKLEFSGKKESILEIYKELQQFI
jgi:hypothetical protein